MAHSIIKPEKLAATAAAVLEQTLTTPALFQREGIDQFRGAKDDAINVKVDGVLPFRTYGWRNDRSASIVWDEYSERKVQIKFGDDLYSGVKLTDEQAEMDFAGWTKLVSKQAEAIGRGLNYGAVDAFKATPFDVNVTLDETNLKSGLIFLRKVMNKLNVQGERTIIADAELEEALLNNADLGLASNVGDRLAESAAEEAFIGRRLGFSFVTANEMEGFSVATTPGAYVLYTAAPSVPQDVMGASASVDGFALRWVRAYNIDKLEDKSVVNAYKSFNYIDDPLVYQDSVTGQPAVSTKNYFVRAVKVDLGAANAVDLRDAELATITGLTDTDNLADPLPAEDVNEV